MFSSRVHSQEAAPTAEKGASDAEKAIAAAEEKAVAAAEEKGQATLNDKATIWSPHQKRQKDAATQEAAVDRLSGRVMNTALTMLRAHRDEPRSAVGAAVQSTVPRVEEPDWLKRHNCR